MWEVENGSKKVLNEFNLHKYFIWGSFYYDELIKTINPLITNKEITDQKRRKGFKTKLPQEAPSLTEKEECFLQLTLYIQPQI